MQLKELSTEMEDKEVNKIVSEEDNSTEDHLEKTTKGEFEEIINSNRNVKVLGI